MPVFYFSQFEHEPFWSYLSWRNDYRAQLHWNFQKWEICEIITMCLNSKSWGYIESIYPRGVLELLSKTQDQVWDFFEKLTWDTYKLKQVQKNFGYPLHSKSVIPVGPYPQDHFIDSHDLLMLVCPLFCAIIVNLLTMVFSVALFVLILMRLVQVWKRK